MDQVAFKERAERRTENNVTVAVVVLTAEEARAAFDVKLYKKKIQPVWLEIANGTDDEMFFLPRSIDPDYFSPLEVAQKTHWRWSKQANQKKRRYFYNNQIPFMIPPGESISGFVFANRSKGVRWVLVEMFSEHKAVHVEFIHEVPGFKADFHKLEDGDLYETFFPDQKIVDITNPEDLRKWIEEQPATVTNADGSKTGDPLNLVIIGDSEAVWPAFLRSGWDPTAAMSAGTAMKTGIFGIFGGAYRYAPSAAALPPRARLSPPTVSMPTSTKRGPRLSRTSSSPRRWMPMLMSVVWASCPRRSRAATSPAIRGSPTATVP
jgi:hypothetical protein